MCVCLCVRERETERERKREIVCEREREIDRRREKERYIFQRSGHATTVYAVFRHKSVGVKFLGKDREK